MSLIQRAGLDADRQRSGGPHHVTVPARTRRSGAWFGWWAALCLTLLAVSTQRQLSIQKQILQESLRLEQAVAQAKAVTAQTNLELEQVAQVEAATAGLVDLLSRVGEVNSLIRTRLEGLDGTVAGIEESVGRIDRQVLISTGLLQEVTGESEQLYQRLVRSRAAGQRLTGHLGRMLRLQEAVVADLAELNRKTAPLERLGGGR